MLLVQLFLATGQTNLDGFEGPNFVTTGPLLGRAAKSNR
jgi:hypothetical protein